MANAGATDDGVSADDLVQVGAIVAAHSLRGEVRVTPTTDFIEERFMRTGSTLRVELQAQGKTKTGYDAPVGDVRAVKVRSGRWVTSKGRTDVIVKLAGCDDRNAAEALIGTRLYVSTTDREALRDGKGANGDGNDEFYAQELEGMTVIEQSTGRVVGIVEDVVRGPGTQDLLKVGLPAEVNDKGETVEFFVYVPFVKDIVPVVNATERTMEITPPGGLLDLKVPKKKAKTASARAKARARRDGSGGGKKAPEVQPANGDDA